MSIGLFDILGPITIGPSSSHTAGAVRIGLVCRMLLDDDIKHARITFYGSFADTYHVLSATLTTVKQLLLLLSQWLWHARVRLLK